MPMSGELKKRSRQISAGYAIFMIQLSVDFQFVERHVSRLAGVA